MWRPSTLRTAGALLVAAMLATTVASLADSPTELCDRLAAEPGAVNGVAGVELAEIDAEAAIAACAAALEEAPGDPRLTYQYARALERAGRLGEAERLYGWAAEDGFGPAVEAQQRLAASAPPPASLPADAAAKAEMLAGLAAVLNRYQASLPPDPADPLTVVAEAGSDPEALLDWVAANTRLVAYQGELRGAEGVLLDRAGNSLDRAQLLAALLQYGGFEVRLARAALTPERARLLLPATLRTVGVPALPALGDAQVAALFGAEQRLNAAHVQAAVAAAEQERSRARALYDERLAVLLPAMKAATVPLAAEAESDGAAQTLAALADHVWVQLRIGGGWRDLDPDGPALGPLVPSETFAPEALPAALRQSVTLRVVLELQDGTGRREETLLHWEGFPADLIDRPVVLSHVPRTLGSIDLGRLAVDPDARDRLLAALDEEQGWIPLLTVGEETVVDRLFTRDGAIAAANANSFATAGGAMVDLFQDIDTVLGGGEPIAHERAEPTAEWLEIEIRTPGAAPVIERRTLFDLVGPAARDAGAAVTFTEAQLRERALRLLGDTQVLILGAAPSELHVTHIETRDLALLAGRLSDLLAAGNVDLDALPTPAPTTPAALYNFASQRLLLSGSAQAANSAPLVVLQHRRLTLSADLAVGAQVEMDIVRNEVAATQRPFLTRLTQGVSDTVLEGVALGEMAGGELADVRNAAALHAADEAAGRRWTRVEPVDPRLSAADLPADYRARLRADIAAGYVVIAPTRAGAGQMLAWWRVEPRSGMALGMLADGGGAVMVEWESIASFMMSAGCTFFIVGGRVGSGEALDPALIGGLAICIASGGFGAIANVPGMLFGSGASIAAVAVHILRGGI